MSDSRKKYEEMEEDTARKIKSSLDKCLTPKGKFLAQPGPKSLEAYDPELAKTFVGTERGICRAVNYVLYGDEDFIGYKKPEIKEKPLTPTENPFLTVFDSWLLLKDPGALKAKDLCKLIPDELLQEKHNQQERQDFQANLDSTKGTQRSKRGGALRFNKGKIRYGLIPENAKRALAEVYTKGAHKYSKYVPKDNPDAEPTLGADIPFEEVGNWILVEAADDNWRKGQNWLGTMESVERHLAAFKSGEDFDPELGTYHLANAAWGLFSILEFYKTFPEGDDRKHRYLEPKKIGLDIDEVLADWVGAWVELHGLKERPENWHFHRDIVKEFDKMREGGTLDDFYLSIKPKISPNDIPFEPHCYITHRPVDTEVTEKWLAMHGFPARPVLTVTPEMSKVDYALQEGLDIFVDDGWNNFVAMNRAGICTYLFDAPHNQRYEVGYKRVKSLKELG